MLSRNIVARTLLAFVSGRFDGRDGLVELVSFDFSGLLTIGCFVEVEMAATGSLEE